MNQRKVNQISGWELGLAHCGEPLVLSFISSHMFDMERHKIGRVS